MSNQLLPPPHPAASLISGRGAYSLGQNLARKPAKKQTKKNYKRDLGSSQKETAQSEAPPRVILRCSLMLAHMAERVMSCVGSNCHTGLPTTAQASPRPSPSPSAPPAAGRTRCSSTSRSAWPRRAQRGVSAGPQPAPRPGPARTHLLHLEEAAGAAPQRPERRRHPAARPRHGNARLPAT